MSFKGELTPEELKKQEKELVKLYFKTQKWLNTHCPVLKEKADKLNHRLFHFMLKHHIKFDFSKQKNGFSDWRANSTFLLVVAGILFMLEAIAFITSGILWFQKGFIHWEIYYLLFFLFFVFILLYSMAIYTIEVSRYNHKEEIDVTQLNAISDANAPKNTLKNNSRATPLQRKFNLIMGIVILSLMSAYFFSPQTLKIFFINDYTRPYLPDIVLFLMEEFFKITPVYGFFILLVILGVISNILALPIKAIDWLSQKSSGTDNTREI